MPGFTCCHPALGREAQVALSLRTLARLEVPAIARAILVPETTMAKRLVRVRSKIATARIPYAIPADAELPGRLYNEFHFYNPSPPGRYSLGTKNKTLQFNDDGSLTLYAGVASPGQTTSRTSCPPQGPFSLYIRGYRALRQTGSGWRERSYGGFGGEHPPSHLGKVRCGVTGHP